jgi:hypothetical protein
MSTFKTQELTGMWTAIGNVRIAARSTNWNKETSDAIVAGIKLAYGQ